MQLADTLVVYVTKKFSKFVNFCLQYGLTALPASQKTLALYVGFLSMEGQVKADYFPQYLSAVRTVHNHLCCEVPAPDMVCNALCTAAVRCQQGGMHDVVKLPLPPGFDVGSLWQAAACQDLFELRLHMFVCLEFLSGVRGASPLGLQRQDVSFVGDMLQVTWRFEKQRCRSAAGRVVQLPLPRCTLFLHVFKGYLARLTRMAKASVWDIPGLPPITNGSAVFAAWMALAQVPQPANGFYSGHSTRSVVAASCRGLMDDIEVVAGVAGWSLRSTAIYKYLHTVLPADQHGFCLFAGLMSTLQQQLGVQVFGDVKIPGPL